MTLGQGLEYVDLRFLGQPGLIATGVLKGRQGAALIDPGPATTLPTLTAELTRIGVALGDVRAILLTHIHLDHAGVTGRLADLCPDAEVIVHERGAPHMIDPSKLVASATRLYQDDMARLWGEILPVRADRVRTLGESDRLSIVGHEIEVAWTPGHASHHVTYFLPAARMAFVGDTAGLCRPSGRLVIPPTPPPDIDLEAWQESTRRILAWAPETLFLTHFGPQAAPRVHFQDLWRRIEDWSARVRASLETPGTDVERASSFQQEVTDEITRLANREEAESYARAGRFDYSWAGLARYWRKKVGPGHRAP
ncbi:MAG TPA: MBL fold metallo-hydrolase [Vicinamibacterales bacterium]|nr:MBL fold metallo-hydrolase [Vicinamibacterales bacterium]